jgi:predicted dehydrogenase
MRALRLALIGGGEAASKALPTLLAHPQIELTGVVCKHDELSGMLPDSLRLERVEQAMERSDVEAVYIATPNSTHAGLVARATDNGKHVLVEKPMCRSLAEARALAASVADRVVLGVAFKKRFGSAISNLRELHEAGSVRRGSYVWNAAIAEDSWRYAASMSGGGVLIDLGAHCLDLVEHLLGPIHAVSARFPRVAPTGVELSAEISLTTCSGVEVELQLTWNHGQPRQEFQLESALTSMRLVRYSSALDVLYSGREQMTLDPRSEYHAMFSAFHRHLNGAERGFPDVSAGIRNHAVLEAVYRAARDGRRTIVE